MSYFYVLLLAIVQGAAELLPVSSSAHVIIVEKLLGLDPTAPDMTFLLVMLHTGTMFAVIFFFWNRWRGLLRQGSAQRRQFIRALVIATLATGAVGFPLKKIIEKIMSTSAGSTVEIEALFGNLLLISVSLFSVGVLILVAGRYANRKNLDRDLSSTASLLIGAVQGLCLPFRGFSRSGATISSALLLRIPKALAEDFSFALAVILTPAVILREGVRLLKMTSANGEHLDFVSLIMPGLVGMLLSFASGWLALRLLSSLMEKGRWQYFSYYCFCLSAVCAVLYFR